MYIRMEIRNELSIGFFLLNYFNFITFGEQFDDNQPELTPILLLVLDVFDKPNNLLHSHFSMELIEFQQNLICLQNNLLIQFTLILFPIFHKLIGQDVIKSVLKIKIFILW